MDRGSEQVGELCEEGRAVRPPARCKDAEDFPAGAIEVGNVPSGAVLLKDL